MAIQRLSNAGQSGFRYKSLIAGITPVASVPTIGAATALTFSTASVAFTAPGAYPATTFTATSSPGGLTGTSATSPITVSGLSEQTAYTFTVTATNATGTSSASAASNSITTPIAWAPESGYDALATVTVPSGGTASVSFVGIPSGYKHLQVRGIGRAATGQSATSLADLFMIINGDTGSNYARHRLLGDGSSASAGATTSQSQIPWTAVFPRTTAASNLFGSFVLDILDYENVSKYKTLRFLGGADINGTGGTIGFQSGLWMSNSAITSMTFTFETDSNPNPSVEFSQLALYGVK